MTLFDELPDLPEELADELCAECHLDIEHCQCAEGFAVLEDPFGDEGDELDEDEGDELDEDEDDEGGPDAA